MKIIIITIMVNVFELTKEEAIAFIAKQRDESGCINHFCKYLTFPQCNMEHVAEVLSWMPFGMKCLYYRGYASVNRLYTNDFIVLVTQTLDHVAKNGTDYLKKFVQYEAYSDETFIEAVIEEFSDKQMPSFMRILIQNYPQEHIFRANYGDKPTLLITFLNRIQSTYNLNMNHVREWLFAFVQADPLGAANPLPIRVSMDKYINIINSIEHNAVLFNAVTWVGIAKGVKHGIVSEDREFMLISRGYNARVSLSIRKRALTQRRLLVSAIQKRNNMFSRTIIPKVNVAIIDKFCDTIPEIAEMMYLSR